MKKRGENIVLPLNVLLELVNRSDKTISINELCNSLDVNFEELMKIIKLLSARGLIILNIRSKHVKLTGLGLLYLRDLKNLLKP